MMTDSIIRVKARKVALERSQRKLKVDYNIRESETVEKYKRAPSKSWKGYNN